MPEFSRGKNRYDDDGLSPAIMPPERPAITWRGETVTPSAIMDLWRISSAARRRSRQRILGCRAMRRRDAATKARLNAKWARKFPEAAAVAGLMLEERVTLERNLIAATGAVEPVLEREPLGFRDTDRDDAEACQSFLNEWLLRCVPTPAFTGKSIEDGEFALINLPSDLDMESCPDFFEYIDDDAREALDDEEKGQYERDDDDTRKRYVKKRPDGTKQPRTRYADMMREPDTDKKRPAPEREKERDRRSDAARKAHEEDVSAYILRKQLDASTTRLIPATECAPVFRRGRRRQRFELTALVTRELYEPWDLLDATDGYRWHSLGDRKLVPQAYRDDGASVPDSDVGVNGKVYVYTAYLPVTDDKGRSHLLLCTTVGGAGTWDSLSGDESNPNSVSVVDLFEEYGVEGEAGGLWPFVTYHFGLHLEDDDPDHYGQPYMHALNDRIKAIEALEGAIRATTVLMAFTGHFETPDPRWAAAQDGVEAILDAAGNLRRTRMPGPGEIETASGAVNPAQQARVGIDAWRLLENDRRALAEATAIDAIPSGSSQSGHALLVQQTLGQVAKRHNRDCVKEAVVACGEAFLRICHGIYRKYDIRWPLRTTQENPIEGETRAGKRPTTFDPDWVLDGQFNLTASYPEEQNIAKIDLEMSLLERGAGNLDRVAAAMGENNAENLRFKADRERLLRTPAADALRMQRIARKLGDRELQMIADLQAQELIAPETPGVPGGVPMAALKRQGEQMGGGGPHIASSVRGGIQGAEMSGAAMAADAQAAAGGQAA